MQRDRLLTHLLSAHSSWNSPARAPQKGHSQGREGHGVLKTGMGSGKFRDQRAEGLPLSREAQWTPGKGMRLGRARSSQGDRTNLSGRHEAAW